MTKARGAHTNLVDQSMAPIAVFAYDRLDCLRSTLKALQNCDGFTKSNVTVFCDGPKSDCLTKDSKVFEVQKFATDWCQHHDAECRAFDSNRGLRISITDGVSEILKNSDRIIVLEDDIVVSPDFLVYMNCMLAAASNRTDIGQVSGYMIPHQLTLPEFGLFRAPASWGWGTWSHAWQKYQDDAKKLAQQISILDLNRFNINGSYDYFSSLMSNAKGAANTWGVRWYASLFVTSALTIYPAVSLTRNIGFGERGTNCGPGRMTRVFNRQKTGTFRRKQLLPADLPVEESPAFVKAFEEFYCWQNKVWGSLPLSERIVRKIFRELSNIGLGKLD